MSLKVNGFKIKLMVKEPKYMLMVVLIADYGKITSVVDLA